MRGRKWFLILSIAILLVFLLLTSCATLDNALAQAYLESIGFRVDFSNPHPPNNQQYVWRDVTLRWEASIYPKYYESVSYNVWVSKDRDAVVSEAAYCKHTTREPQLKLSDLDKNKTYYWKVEAVVTYDYPEEEGAKVIGLRSGPIWSFTTGEEFSSKSVNE